MFSFEICVKDYTLSERVFSQITPLPSSSWIASACPPVIHQLREFVIARISPDLKSGTRFDLGAFFTFTSTLTYHMLKMDDEPVLRQETRTTPGMVSTDRTLSRNLWSSLSRDTKPVGPDDPMAVGIVAAKPFYT
jgi:hypothetical protein